MNKKSYKLQLTCVFKIMNYNYFNLINETQLHHELPSKLQVENPLIPE